MCLTNLTIYMLTDSRHAVQFPLVIKKAYSIAQCLKFVAASLSIQLHPSAGMLTKFAGLLTTLQQKRHEHIK